MSADSKISFYNSARDVAPSKEITVREFVRIIRCGDFSVAVDAVRNAIGDEAKRAAKMKLPAAQLSGCVTDGNRAKAMAEGRFVHSGILQLDIDGDGLNGKRPTEARDIIGKDPYVLTAFLSPSGKGAKGLFRVRPCTSDDQHKLAFLAVEKHILDNYGLTLDPAPKNSGSLCYISSDPQSTWQPMAEEFVQPTPTKSKPQVTPAKRPASKGFPLPPVSGIHTWLMQAAWHCRLQDRMDEAETITRLESFNGTLRRPYQDNEVNNAVKTVFSSPMPTSRFDITERTRTADLTAFTLTDSGNAERVFSCAGGNFRYVSESGQWLTWNGCRWNPDNSGQMVRLFVATMKQTGKQAFGMREPKAAEAVAKFALRSLDSNRVTAGLQMLKSILGVTAGVNDLDADPWMIGTPDGMIDLKTGLPIEPDPALLITKSIGTHHDPMATCPTWERFLETATGGDMELNRYLQAAVGYTLTGSNREQCLFFLHGSGSNGKGVFSETVKRLLGDYGQTAPETMFTKDRHNAATNDIARLAGCRLAISAELEENTSFAESRIKALTGGDSITARFLHQEYFDFRPTHHFWISGNHKPNVRGSDLGIWRRIRLIPFTVRIADSQKDPNLADKLAGEMPGILNWALAGCLRWQREGLITPKCVLAATEEYRAEEDVIGQFLSECTREESGERVPISSLYEGYQEWALGEGIKHPLTARVFNRKLDERGLVRTKSNGGRFWEGIATI